MKSVEISRKQFLVVEIKVLVEEITFLVFLTELVGYVMEMMDLIRLVKEMVELLMVKQMAVSTNFLVEEIMDKGKNLMQKEIPREIKFTVVKITMGIQEVDQTNFLVVEMTNLVMVETPRGGTDFVIAEIVMVVIDRTETVMDFVMDFVRVMIDVTKVVMLKIPRGRMDLLMAEIVMVVIGRTEIVMDFVMDFMMGFVMGMIPRGRMDFVMTEIVMVAIGMMEIVMDCVMRVIVITRIATTEIEMDFVMVVIDMTESEMDFVMVVIDMIRIVMTGTGMMAIDMARSVLAETGTVDIDMTRIVMTEIIITRIWTVDIDMARIVMKEIVMTGSVMGVIDMTAISRMGAIVIAKGVMGTIGTMDGATVVGVIKTDTRVTQEDNRKILNLGDTQVHQA
jgi:hypothetical protein